MPTTLVEVIHAYLADTNFRQARVQRAARRDASIPALRVLVQEFIGGDIDIQSFRKQLDKTLHAREDWGATGTGFMMELNKFGKYHNDTSSYAEEQLRNILRDLSASNLGQRIEQCYKFLLQERDRLRREGKSSNMIVAARNSAFMISLFAFWLDAEHSSIIYYESLRKGVFLLIKAYIVSQPPNLQLGPNAIEVHSNADHQACLHLLDSLAEQDARIKNDAYWAENFCLWITQHLQSLAEPTNTLIKEIDINTRLSHRPSQPETTHETLDTYVIDIDGEQSSDSVPESGITQHSTTQLIENGPLQATPEPLLTRLIQEVQRQILLDEETIRSIYYALLAGHVILSGPPGTGKTELARIIPEYLWRSEENPESDDESEPNLTTKSAYTTQLVTATDEWSVRTLISGIAPQSQNGSITYSVQYGHLTTAILKNWSFQGNQPQDWSNVTLQRNTVTTTSGFQRGVAQYFRGQWLVIDEFNRAPIDLALGDALTALGGNDVLRVAIDGGTATLPIPQDFRIIGTLNSFDRSYLNQISEALKRRFSFIEINPPGRTQRAAEQSIALYKALKKISHLSPTIAIGEDDSIYWQGYVTIGSDSNGTYTIDWEQEKLAFQNIFEQMWNLLEIIRIYRQLGTAQTITLLQHMLIRGVLENYTTEAQWHKALDHALCHTIADQLQVLLPDEIDVLHTYLSIDHTSFGAQYNTLLMNLTSTQQRLTGQLLALGSVRDNQNQPILSDEEIERIVAQDQPQVSLAVLHWLFHLESSPPELPQFTRRLRLFKAERGL
ncbi:AAA family ATPase [Ktedonospora formicarum]|uniref:AAA+ ATPase domain-containing protein n=1 Tax=Ktedonospora formicarum TaxID=2778364 RepID=A0A8J3MUR8_9CHLR|nr:AAA family ATPase [Ktedonospora formicarum]GHO49632.1 hypothetical protein KSX_77950 [Ktedonospora formicarum]